MSTRELVEARHRLSARLRERRPDVEAAIAARIYSIAPLEEGIDPSYVEGLRNSLGTAIDYALEAVDAGEQRAPDVPPPLLAQARMAARSGIALDTVLRRYLAGFSVLTEFVLEDVARGRLPRRFSLQEVLRGQTATLDRLLAAVTDAYVKEESTRLSSDEERRAERVKRLLAGEPLDLSAFEYDFDCRHVGFIALGSDSARAARAVARGLDCRLLFVRIDEATAWGWIGSRRNLDSGEVAAAIGEIDGQEPKFIVGEPGGGIEGWRRTHRQAGAALPIALRRTETVTFYSDHPVLSAVFANSVLHSSLEHLYLEPLRAGDGSEDLLQALRAYFAADCNASSAAAALGLSRNTVSSRIRIAEERLGRSISECRVGLELALQLASLESLH